MSRELKMGTPNRGCDTSVIVTFSVPPETVILLDQLQVDTNARSRSDTVRRLVLAAATKASNETGKIPA